MGEMDDNASTAYGFAAGAGGVLAEAAGIAGGVTGIAVAGAAAVGVGIGTGLEYVTDGAISDTISDGLMGLVGDEHSLAAVNDFDDGNYIAGAGEMLEGAGETIYDTASDWAGSAADTASDWASSAADTAEGAWDAVTDLF